jgi:hypothetical protein
MADEKQQSAGQVTDSILGAINIMTEHAVQGLQFDRTEVAEIVDITNRANGDYVVFNGSARYHAYTENTSYTLGTKVYVNIPNNDMSGEKTIIRKYNLKDSNRGLSYISPLNRYTPSGENILTVNGVTTRTFYFNNDQGAGLLANYNKKATTHINPDSQEILLCKITNMQEYTDNPNFQGFKYLGLSAKFKTLLSGQNTNSGNYGLKIRCDFSRRMEGQQSNEVMREKHTYVLDTKNMIGSLYNFFADFEQQALFELPDVDTMH